MFLVVKNRLAKKAETAREAAAKTLALEHADVLLDHESERRAFVEAHDALVTQRIQNGIGFAT